VRGRLVINHSLPLVENEPKKKKNNRGLLEEEAQHISRFTESFVLKILKIIPEKERNKLIKQNLFSFRSQLSRKK
jgi:hypothetical protein